MLKLSYWYICSNQELCKGRVIRFFVLRSLTIHKNGKRLYSKWRETNKHMTRYIQGELLIVIGLYFTYVLMFYLVRWTVVEHETQVNVKRGYQLLTYTVFLSIRMETLSSVLVYPCMESSEGGICTLKGRILFSLS